MTLRHLISVAVLAILATNTSTTVAQTPAVPARDLIKAVAANELQDRVRQLKWMYVIEKRVGSQIVSEEQVETTSGPIYRIIAIDGAPLSVDQRQRDDSRIALLLHDPSQQAKLKQQQDEDEKKLETMMRIMPDAFLYDYDGVDGRLVRLNFRPDPNYDPPTYEARVVHSLAGTMLIEPEQKRLAKLSGQVMNQVDFGFGFLGHIDKGGTIELGRIQVGPGQWKTALIHIQLSGRLVFFKTIDKQEFETRAKFRSVAGDISLVAARELLVH